MPTVVVIPYLADLMAAVGFVDLTADDSVTHGLTNLSSARDPRLRDAVRSDR